MLEMTLQIFLLFWIKRLKIASCEIIINGDKKVKKDLIKGNTFIYHDDEPPAYGKY